MVYITIATTGDRLYDVPVERGTSINKALRKYGVKVCKSNRCIILGKPRYLFKGQLVDRNFKIEEDGVLNVCQKARLRYI